MCVEIYFPSYVPYQMLVVIVIVIVVVVVVT